MYSHKSLILAALGSLSVQALPTGNDVTVSSITHWGSGCPQDTSTFSVNINSDASSIVANFGSFDVTLSPQSDSTEFCGIGVQFSVPAGVQFSAVSTTYRDNINVGAGATATHLLTYTFSTSDALATTRHDYIGPLKGTFDCTDTVPDSDRVWSTCGDPLELLITNRGSVTDDDSTTSSTSSGTSYFNSGSVTTSLEWRSC